MIKNIQDVILNENRHLLYNLLDNYYNTKNQFWGNPLHTMLVSCTFNMIFIQGYLLRSLTGRSSADTVSKFFSIPNLSITENSSDNSKEFYYYDKLFAYKSKDSLDYLHNITGNIKDKPTYILLNATMKEDKPFKFFRIEVPTNYTNKTFSNNTVDKCDTNNLFLDIGKFYNGQSVIIENYSDTVSNNNTNSVVIDDDLVKSVMSSSYDNPTPNPSYRNQNSSGSKINNNYDDEDDDPDDLDLDGLSLADYEDDGNFMHTLLSIADAYADTQPGFKSGIYSFVSGYKNHLQNKNKSSNYNGFDDIDDDDMSDDMYDNRFDDFTPYITSKGYA